MGPRVLPSRISWIVVAQVPRDLISIGQDLETITEDDGRFLGNIPAETEFAVLGCVRQQPATRFA